jgi:predicted small lipoprotein YifL
MKKRSSWFTLISAVAVSVVAAGCGSSGPVSAPSELVSDSSEADGSFRMAALAPRGCDTITSVRLQRVPSTSIQVARVTATYFAGRTPVKCEMPPVWSSVPRGALVETKDPFAVGAKRNPLVRFTLVTAEAPNGVVGQIRITN